MSDSFGAPKEKGSIRRIFPRPQSQWSCFRSVRTLFVVDDVSKFKWDVRYFALVSRFITVVDPFLLPAFVNVLRFLAVSVPFGIIMVTLTALMLHARPGKISMLMRTVYFIPGAVAGPALVLLFLFTLNPDLSVFRNLLTALGFTHIKEIVNNDGAPFVYTLMGFFGGAGAWIAIFYGALQGVSEEIMEAAVMDGCNPVQLAWHIKASDLPLHHLRMTILVLAGNIQIFTEPQLMSNVSATLHQAVVSEPAGILLCLQPGKFWCRRSCFGPDDPYWSGYCLYRDQVHQILLH